MKNSRSWFTVYWVDCGYLVALKHLGVYFGQITPIYVGRATLYVRRYGWSIFEFRMIPLLVVLGVHILLYIYVRYCCESSVLWNSWAFRQINMANSYFTIRSINYYVNRNFNETNK